MKNNNQIKERLEITSNISTNKYWTAWKGNCEKCNIEVLLLEETESELSVHHLGCFDDNGNVIRIKLKKQTIYKIEEL